MTRSRVLVLLCSLVLGLGLAPSGPGPPHRRPEQLAGPGYHEPAVGLCYDLTAKQANKASATQDAVPCDAPHTLMTIKVKRLAKPVKWTAVYSRIVVSCYEALYDALGSAKLAEMSSYDLWWFIPTKDERAQGARWARCDVGLHKGTSGLGKGRPRSPSVVCLSTTSTPGAWSARLSTTPRASCPTSSGRRRRTSWTGGPPPGSSTSSRAGGAPGSPTPTAMPSTVRRTRSGRPATTSWSASSPTEPQPG